MKANHLAPLLTLSLLASATASSLALRLPVTAPSSQPAASQSEVSVVKTSLPQKRLDFSVDLPAPIDQVWNCFATRAGMITWLSPDADLQLQPGGHWYAKFPGGQTAGGIIVNFTPQQQITIHAMAPETFPDVRREGTSAVFTFVALDDTHTRLYLSQTGWKSGDQWDKAYDYLARGNAFLLTGLRNRFVHGPVDWAKELSNDAPQPANKNP